jgi:hypothetical protein
MCRRYLEEFIFFEKKKIFLITNGKISCGFLCFASQSTDTIESNIRKEYFPYSSVLISGIERCAICYDNTPANPNGMNGFQLLLCTWKDPKIITKNKIPMLSMVIIRLNRALSLIPNNKTIVQSMQIIAANGDKTRKETSS